MPIPSFISKCLLLVLIPSIVARPLYGFYDETYLRAQTYQDPYNENSLISYDKVLEILKDIESGALESRCNEKTLIRINNWLSFLARAGVIPGDTACESLLEIDIDDLNDNETNFEFGSCFDEDAKFMLIPTLESHRFEAFICGGWLSKKWKQTKKFVAAHKKEILIGAAVIVGAAIIVGAVTYGLGAAAASAAAGAANSNDHNKTAAKTSDVTNQAETIKEMVLSKDLTSITDPHFPMEDNARILGQACAQAAFEKLQNSVTCNTYFSSDLEKMGGLKPDTYHLIDQAFSKPIPWYSWDYSSSFKENVYSARAAYATDLKLYDQAYSDYDKILKFNPNNSDAYLNRALTYFETGQIDKAAADFQKYIELRSEPIKDMKEFSIGFARGLGRGVKDSGAGLCEFAGEVACHPISTARKMYDSGKMLFELTKSKQWGEIAEMLSPEAFELATQWEYLSFERRGDLSGYVFGKHGADFLIPGAGFKLVKGVMGELTALSSVFNAASKAEKALVLESIASGSVKIADASFGIKTVTGLKELGEVGFIKHIEHLQSNQMFNFSKAAFDHMYEPGRWVPMHLLKEIIEYPLAVVPDPRKMTKANMYYSQISRNKKLYNIEVLYDPVENKISHFKYTDDALGPLNKIRK